MSPTTTGDRIYSTLLGTAGACVLAMMGVIGLFLGGRGGHALRVAGWSFLTTSQWEPDVHRFGIAGLLAGSILIALVGVAIAFPLALGLALFVSEVVPERLRRPLTLVLDFTAAVPSVVFALWGFEFFSGHYVPVARWIASWFGWIPFLSVPGFHRSDPLATASQFSASSGLAGVVVGVMITPIMCSMMREGFSRAPVGEREGAYALGSTRWGMIRNVVLPFGRPAVIGGAMLGLGRLLGETIVVYLLISPASGIQWHILSKGANSISANVALRYNESSSFGLSALMASGLALFALALAVNVGASMIVRRSGSGVATH